RWASGRARWGWLPGPAARDEPRRNRRARTVLQSNGRSTARAGSPEGGALLAHLPRAPHAPDLRQGGDPPPPGWRTGPAHAQAEPARGHHPPPLGPASPPGGPSPPRP